MFFLLSVIDRRGIPTAMLPVYCRRHSHTFSCNQRLNVFLDRTDTGYTEVFYQYFCYVRG